MQYFQRLEAGGKRWAFKPHRNCRLKMEGEHRCSQTVPNDMGRNVETSSAEYHCCSQHGHVTTFRRTGNRKHHQVAAKPAACADCL